MNRVKITCDSSADLANLQEIVDGVLPMLVTLGDRDFIDIEEITPDDIYKFVEENGVLPKTAARSMHDYEEFFKEQTKDGSHVVHFSISQKLSMSFDNAVKGAKNVPNVWVLDGKTLSTGTGLLILEAIEEAKKGLSAQEIFDNGVQRREKLSVSFVVATMEYLHKGGRCSGMTAFVASRLMIKPCLALFEGEIKVHKKYMTYKKAVAKYVKDIFKDFPNPDTKRISVTHTSADQKFIDLIVEEWKNTWGFEEILINIAGSTITSHCGKGTIGLMYLTK